MEPGPSPEQLKEMLRAAVRAPDHAWLRPWRFIEISGDRRQAFGQLLHDALLRRNPEADEVARTKALNAPLRAPMLLVSVVTLRDHHKVPHVEQRLSVGCASQAILLAAETLDLAGVWRTGAAAFDRFVMDGLGLGENEEIIGFLYLGTRDGKAKTLPEVNLDEVISSF